MLTQDVPELGVVACWHFQAEDFVPECANRKIKAFAGGHKLLVNAWVGGSGYLTAYWMGRYHNFIDEETATAEWWK